MLLASSSTALYAQATGSVQGTVKDDSGKALAGINVFLATSVPSTAIPTAGASSPGASTGGGSTAAPPTPGASANTPTATTDSGGNFSFSGVQPGNYTICLLDTGNSHLDPCAWSTGTQVTVIANQTAAASTVTATASATLQVRVDDPQQLLTPNSAAGVPFVGVILAKGGLAPVNMVSSDSGGRTFQVAVPPGDHKLVIRSSTLKIANGQGQDLDGPAMPNGVISIIPVDAPVSVSSGMSYVSVTITGTR